MCFEGGEGAQAQEYSPLEAEKGSWIFLSMPPKGTSPADNLTLACVSDDFRLMTSRTIK